MDKCQPSTKPALSTGRAQPRHRHAQPGDDWTARQAEAECVLAADWKAACPAPPLNLRFACHDFIAASCRLILLITAALFLY